MGFEIQAHVEKYSRLDGINRKWLCEFTGNLCLIIAEGTLFVFYEKKLLEAVFLLHQESVKIAVRKRILGVAYVNEGFLVRFRLIFPAEFKESEMKPTLKVINHYSTIIRMKGNNNVEAENTLKNNKIVAVSSKSDKKDVKFKEISLDNLKKLAEYGETNEQKRTLQLLILDPQFLQYLLILNKSKKKN